MTDTTPNPLSSGSDDMGRVLLMRHAQTSANAQGYFLGRRDEGVTGLGERQSRQAVEGLVAWHPDRIITSPLKRCREFIAEPAADALGIAAQIDERLIEFDFGPIEGIGFADVVERDMPFPWGPRAAGWPPPAGGETFQAFGERLSELAHDLELMQGRTAVVAHGGVIRGFFSVWLGMDTDDINHLIVCNVDSFVFRMRPGFAELESYGIHPEDLGRY